MNTYVVVQGAVSVALLAFAGLIHGSDPTTASTIVGAVLSLWVRETVHYGQQAAAERKEERNGNGVH